MELMMMFGVPFLIGVLAGVFFKMVINKDKHKSRLDKEMSEIFDKYKE